MYVHHLGVAETKFALRFKIVVRYSMLKSRFVLYNSNVFVA